MSVVLAVLGRDVSRSLSPKLHRAAAQERCIGLDYRALSCPEEAAFKEAIRGLANEGALGASVTIPWKHAALRLCSELSPVASAIGAVNRLTFEGARIFGDNTDGPALVSELLALPKAALERVQILGAGGAARAVAWALHEIGAGSVVVAARDANQAKAVAALADGTAAPLGPVEGATLVVSTLPQSKELAQLALDRWIAPAPSLWVFDLAYGAPPRSSLLVEAAAARGLSSHDGLGMLVEQAALAFDSWMGGGLSRTRAAMWAGLRGAL